MIYSQPLLFELYISLTVDELPPNETEKHTEPPLKIHYFQLDIIRLYI